MMSIGPVQLNVASHPLTDRVHIAYLSGSNFDLQALLSGLGYYSIVFHNLMRPTEK